MNMSLREFIKQQVGGEMGDPWVFNNVTDLLQRVARLEGGVGLTVSIPDVIALNIQKSEAFNGLIDSVIVPTDGTVKGFYGAASTEHTTARLRILRTSTVLGEYSFSAQITANPQYLSLDIKVRGGDVLSFFLEGETIAAPVVGAAAAEEEPEEPSTEEPPTEEPPVEEPPKPDFTDVMGAFLIELPAKVYSGGTV